MKSTLRKVLCFMFCLCLPFCLVACSFEVDDEGEDVPSAETLISGVSTISLGDGSETYLEVLGLVDDLTTKLIDGLYNEYGATSTLAVFRDSTADTHKNAIWQDKWLWAGKENYGTELGGSSLWSLEALDKADYSLLLKYNIMQILLNKSIEDVEVVNLTTNSKYFQMKQQGLFEEEYFTNLAKQVAHTGLFYYEADAIAEYILDYVIGESAVALDLNKFVDFNGNGTFDYNEDVKRDNGQGLEEYRYSIIKNYSLNKPRAESTSRSDVWNSIEFGTSLVEVLPSNSDIENERAYSIDYLRTNNITNSYMLDGATLYSGFKNYVNTVYYLVYSSVDNILTMEHKPNASFKDVETIDVSIPFDDGGEDAEDIFKIEADTYYSAIIKAKEDLSLTSLWLFIELDESITETVEFSIDATYNHCVDTTTHSHSETCVYEKILSNLGTIKVKPGKIDENSESLYADLTMTEEVIEDLKESGVNTDGIVITEFTKNGIYSFDLTKYVEKMTTNGEGEEVVAQKNLVANESTSLVGCVFEYENELNDYIEVKFNIISEHENPIKFKFAFFW